MLLKKHERWKSKNVKKGYVHKNLWTFLSVFKDLDFGIGILYLGTDDSK